MKVEIISADIIAQARPMAPALAGSRGSSGATGPERSPHFQTRPSSSRANSTWHVEVASESKLYFLDQPRQPSPRDFAEREW